jgi:hypothetical protein
MISENNLNKKHYIPEGASETLSPYAPNFWTHIEKGIKPLVSSFLNKGYLTYSSCEGHSICGRRFIALAFPSLEEANSFILSIESLKEPLLFLTVKEPKDYYHDPKYGCYNELNHTRWLNTLYFRGYSEYRFVEISIGINSPPKIKNLGLILNKLINRDRVTQKLKDFVNSENFHFFKS